MIYFNSLANDSNNRGVYSKADAKNMVLPFIAEIGPITKTRQENCECLQTRRPR